MRPSQISGQDQREKTIVWQPSAHSARDAAAISGLDYLESVRDGKIAPPPVAALLGYRIHAVRHGYAAYRIAPEECHYNPFSIVHGGILSTLLDTAMTASVLSTLPKGQLCTTVEVKINFVRSATDRSGPLVAEGRPIHIGGRLATAEGRLTDADGRLYAHGLTTCSIITLKP